MSDSNDTSTIDEKNAENNGSSTKDNNISGLLSAFVGGLIGIYIYSSNKGINSAQPTNINGEQVGGSRTKKSNSLLKTRGFYILLVVLLVGYITSKFV